MATVWSSQGKPQRPPKLVEWGAYYSKRILHETESTLYGRQKEALESLVEWFGSEETRDYTATVVMPTGSGKTGVICCLPYVIGGAIANGAISSETIKLNKPILVIAPNLDILEQLEEDFVDTPFLKKRGFLGDDDMEDYYTVHTIDETSEVKKLISRKSNDIILTNSQKFRRDKSSDELNFEKLPGDLLSMVIVDEAHHLPAKQWQNIIQHFRGHAKVVFFTATPYRVDGRPITADGAITAKGYAYELIREDAIAEKLIRGVKFIELPYSDEVREDHTYYKEVLTEVKKYLDQKNMKLLPGNTKHAAIIITKMIGEADKVRHICTEELGFAKNRVAVVHTETMRSNRRARKAKKEKIKDGEYDIVIVVQMLLEGFDYPPFSIAGIITNIVSVVKFTQFIGRIQRVMRVKNQDRGEMEMEENVVGDIITHKVFEQEKLYKLFLNPPRPDKPKDANSKCKTQPAEG